MVSQRQIPKAVDWILGAGVYKLYQHRLAHIWRSLEKPSLQISSRLYLSISTSAERAYKNSKAGGFRKFRQDCSTTANRMPTSRCRNFMRSWSLSTWTHSSFPRTTKPQAKFGAEISIDCGKFTLSRPALSLKKAGTHSEVEILDHEELSLALWAEWLSERHGKCQWKMLIKTLVIFHYTPWIMETQKNLGWLLNIPRWLGGVIRHSKFSAFRFLLTYLALDHQGCIKSNHVTTPPHLDWLVAEEMVIRGSRVRRLPGGES